MAGLKLHISNRLEVLSGKLAEVLSFPLASPLQPEVILVQSKGMERWVSMELARYNGICANIRFPFPNHFVYEVFREIIPELEDVSIFTPEVLTWKIRKILPAQLNKPEFRSLSHYLSEGAHDLKLFQLSQRVADLFDQYLLFRPEMILNWEKGADSHWQAILWRQLFTKNEGKHRAALKKIFQEEIRKPPTRLENLPERITVFGISALPMFHLEILAAISRLIEVNLFLVNPCLEYWGNLLTSRETRKTEEKARGKRTPREDLHLESGNSLLSSMGMLGRDFFELLSAFEAEEREFFVQPGENNLLACLQSDILSLRDRSSGNGGQKSLDKDDDSIQIHSCHSPMREVEVLQDNLLSFFESDPTLLPKDILIMTPDIATYSPFIQAVFSLPPDDPRSIPFSIADRGIHQESRLVDAFLSLLDFQNSRFGVSQVMALLESQAVQKRFSLSEENLELIQRWVRATRIRWGVDQESRKNIGLPELMENTWRAGLNRMLLGYALPGHGEKMFRDILPYDEIEGNEAVVLGNFVALAERLFTLAKELREPRELRGWGDFLTQILDEFFQADEDSERDVLLIRGVLCDLGEKQQLSGFDEKINLGVIKSHLQFSLEKESFGHGFLTGGLTFCAMLPMRSIPSKVICLLGMNDDTYPRQNKTLGFDLMAKNPKPGDRSRRNDDRYLFLETILSASEKLYISYVGQSIQDNSIRPPSVLVSELLDTLEEGYEMPGEKMPDHIVIKHNLQAFNSQYYTNKGKLFSYSRENFEAAKSALAPLKTIKSFISQGLPEPLPEWKTVDINHLVRFLVNPVKFLLNQRLGIYLEEEEAIFNDLEPFQVTGLDKYQLEQGLAEKGYENQDLSDAFAAVKASGQLPHGTPGECFYRESCQGLGDFIDRLSPYRREVRLEPLEVDLSLGEYRIQGRIEGIYTSGLLHFRYATVKPSDRLRIRINHLILNMTKTQSYPGNGILVCKDVTCKYPPLKGTEDLLKYLLGAYWRGLTKPLHFFPLSSWTYAEALDKGKSRQEALELAGNKWAGSDFSRGEIMDPYNQVCFAHTNPIDEEFTELSEMIFKPLLECEEKIQI